MPTIKRKVEMNLPELIEWCWENDIKNERYRCSDTIPYEYVWINENYDVELDDDMRISKNDTFTVEVEEEITEDTELEALVERYMSDYEDAKPRYAYHLNKSIKSVLKGNMPHIKTTHFYKEVNDELVLIWKNGKMVE